MGRKAIYTDEERLILNKCKVDEVYKMTKLMLGLSQEELKKTHAKIQGYKKTPKKIPKNRKLQSQLEKINKRLKNV